MIFIKYKEIFIKARENSENFFKNKKLNSEELKSFYFGQYYYIMYQKKKLKNYKPIILTLDEKYISLIRDNSKEIFLTIYNSQINEKEKSLSLQIHSIITNNDTKNENENLNKI